MMGFRLFCAFFLAAIVGFTFRRSWGLEHGKPAGYLNLFIDEEKGKETVVFMSPLVLPIMMIVFLGLFIITQGVLTGLTRFFALSLGVVVIFSIYYILLLALLPILRRYFSARACATLWVIPVFVFYQANIMYQNGYNPLHVIYIPAEVLRWFLYIWIVGFLAVFLAKVVGHFMFRHKIMSSAWDIEDEDILALWKEELSRADYKKPVRLVFSKSALAPLSMGRTEEGRVTVMPYKEFSPEDIRFIFRHEIRHLQRSDVDTKIFLAFCSALCWFNPLVWMGIRKASEDMELSCDEIVLEEADESTRRRYAELLLQTASDGQGFTTCLSSAGKSMRYRLKNVISSHNRWTGTILVATAMFLCTMGYGAVAISSNSGALGDVLLDFDAQEARIKSVYYSDIDNNYDNYTKEMNVEKLYKYILSLEVAELNDARGIRTEYFPYIDFSIYADNESILITVRDKEIEVWEIYGSDKKSYLLRSDIDWDYIWSVLEAN